MAKYDKCVVVVDDESGVLNLISNYANVFVGPQGRVVKARNFETASELADELYADGNKPRWLVDGLHGYWRKVAQYVKERTGSYSDMCVISTDTDHVDGAREMGIKAIGKDPRDLGKQVLNDLREYFQLSEETKETPSQSQE